MTGVRTEQRWAARLGFAQEAALAEVVLAFASHGVRPLLIKGRATTRLLGLDPATRPSVDLDLLVAASEHPAAARVLAGLGFADALRGARASEAARVHARVWTRGSPVPVSIDLHHALAHVRDSETLFATLSRDAKTIAVGPAAVEVPGDGACALIVVLHAAHHTPMTRPLEDLRLAARSLPDPIWREAATLAAELGAVDSFAFGLRLVDEGRALADRLNIHGDGSLRDQLRARAWEDGPVGIHRLRTAPTAGAAATVLRDALVPSPAFVRANHPELGSSRARLAAYYLRRWLRIPRALVRYVRVMATKVLP